MKNTLLSLALACGALLNLTPKASAEIEDKTINGRVAYQTDAVDESLGGGLYRHYFSARLFDDDDPNVFLYNVRCNRSQDDGNMSVTNHGWVTTHFDDYSPGAHWHWVGRFDG